MELPHRRSTGGTEASAPRTLRGRRRRDIDLPAIRVSPGPGSGALVPGEGRFLRLVRTTWFQVLLVFVLALLVRLAGIHRAAFNDELYHMLAARNFLAEGTLSINGGDPYDRGRLFTMLVVGLQALFGENLALIRLPSVVAGSGLVAAVFLWLRALDRTGAAWLAAILLCFFPWAISSSQWVRFYSFQQLAVLLAAIAAYYGSLPRVSGRRRLGCAASVIASLLVAVYLQLVSIVAVVGISAFVAVETFRMAGDRGFSLRSRLTVVAGLAALGALMTLTVGRGYLTLLVEQARYVDSWALAAAGEFRYYHWWLREEYPSLWTLFPVLLVVAAASHFRLTLLCALIFVPAIVGHSFVAWKAERYMLYAVPFFLVIASLAVAALVPPFLRCLRSVLERWSWLARGPVRLRAAMLLSTAAVLGFVLASNHAFIVAARMVLEEQPEFHEPHPGQNLSAWAAAVPVLSPIADAVDVVVTARSEKSLFYLRRGDYKIARSRLFDRGEWLPEFSMDTQVMMPLISRPESLAAIMACYQSGMVVLDVWQSTIDWIVPADLMGFMRAEMEPVAMPPEWGLMAFTWSSPGAGAPTGSACPPGEA